LNGVANLIGIVGLSVAGAVLVVLWLRSVQELVAMAMWYILHSYAALQCLFLTNAGILLDIPRIQMGLPNFWLEQQVLNRDLWGQLEF
jgi:hypothetical protein